MTRLILQGGQIFDGTSDKTSTGDVLVEDGRIVEVGSGLDGDEAVDCSGRLVTPGLFDCHVHFMVDGDFYRAATAFEVRAGRPVEFLIP